MIKTQATTQTPEGTSSSFITYPALKRSLSYAVPTALRFLIALAQRWRVGVRTVPPSGHGIPIVGIVVTFVPENELDIYAALGFGL